MRISDWSSDVCSSDLIICGRPPWRSQRVKIGLKKALGLIFAYSAMRAVFQRMNPHISPPGHSSRSLASCSSAVRLCSRSEEHTSELQSLMRISYAVFCLKKTINHNNLHQVNTHLNH